MALGIFAVAFEKRSLPPCTRVRWRGMVRCGAFATKARKSMVVETSFAGALVRECTDRVRRTSLRARRCCKVVAWLYLDLGHSRTAESTSRELSAMIFSSNIQKSHPFCIHNNRTKITSLVLYHCYFQTCLGVFSMQVASQFPKVPNFHVCMCVRVYVHTHTRTHTLMHGESVAWGVGSEAPFKRRRCKNNGGRAHTSSSIGGSPESELHAASRGCWVASCFLTRFLTHSINGWDGRRICFRLSFLEFFRALAFSWRYFDLTSGFVVDISVRGFFFFASFCDERRQFVCSCRAATLDCHSWPGTTTFFFGR